MHAPIPKVLVLLSKYKSETFPRLCRRSNESNPFCFHLRSKKHCFQKSLIVVNDGWNFIQPGNRDRLIRISLKIVFWGQKNIDFRDHWS